jgi:alcohol dehydrogenase
MQAHRYPEMLEMVRTGKLEPQKLIGKTVSLDDSVTELADMNSFSSIGVTVINSF